MDDLSDFIEGDILGTQISSSQIQDFINCDITHSRNLEKVTDFVRKLDIRDVLAIQRFIGKEIGSICDRNKSMFGVFVFVYLAFTVPLLYVCTEAGVTSLIFDIDKRVKRVTY